MKIFVRVDASLRIGTGHIVRCRTLAHELTARGAAVEFLCREHEGNQIAMLKSSGFPVHALPEPTGPPDSFDEYAQWLGTSQRRDASDTIAAMAGGHADCLIVDHYALDARWEKAMRPHTSTIVVIDDLANRDHDCEILLDQNFGADDGRYADLLPQGCRALLGPRFSLLAPAYRAIDSRARESVLRVMVFFGGVDTNNATGLALKALSHPDLAYLEIDVILGAANRHREYIISQADRRGRTRVDGPLPNLAGTMADADLAIGAGGTTMWERLCAGLPSLVISLAGNQEPGSEALAAAGLIDYAGPLEKLNELELRARTIALIRDSARIRKLSFGGPFVVDGFGAPRAAELILPTKSASLTLRPATASDAILFFHWANDPEARRQSLSSDPITWEAHSRWYRGRVESELCHIFVLEAGGGLPVGQIRFDIRDDAVAKLSYSLDPIVRGRGWARKLVELGLAWLWQVGDFEVQAEVKDSNPASLAVFDHLGFRFEVANEGVRDYRARASEVRKWAIDND